jgi:hypothetical protein
MSDDKLRQKAHGDQEQYFRKQDEELLKNLRQRSKLGDLTNALAEKLQIDDPGLLKRVMDLGVTLETGPAFLLAPLVQVAWAEGKVTAREKRVILGIAEQRGIARGSQVYALVEQWLEKRPSDEFFATAIEAVRVGLSVLPPEERAARIEEIVGICREVAASSGGLARELGLSSGIDEQEKAILEAITKKLTA